MTTSFPRKRKPRQLTISFGENRGIVGGLVDFGDRVMVIDVGCRSVGIFPNIKAAQDFLTAIVEHRDTTATTAETDRGARNHEPMKGNQT